MKKILGLDLGSASIGWALIEENNNKNNNYWTWEQNYSL